jgi:hypothetical protein
MNRDHEWTRIKAGPRMDTNQSTNGDEVETEQPNMGEEMVKGGKTETEQFHSKITKATKGVK